MPVVDKHEFKPLLAEIEDSPVSPLGRTIFWTVLLVFSLAIAWAVFGEVDIVVSAQGKVIPDGQVKIVQPLETGVIQRILVKEGDHVKKNQLLMEIDPSSTSPEVETNTKNFAYAKLEQERLNATISGSEFAPASQNDKGSETQLALYKATRQDLTKQLRMREEELKKIDQQMDAARAEQLENETLLNVAKEKETRLKSVIDLIAKDEYDKVLNDLVSYKSKIDQSSCKLQELAHQKSQTAEEIAHIEQDFIATNLKELAEKQREATELEAKVKVANFQNAQKLVNSPVDGHVDSLFVHTVGGVVTPAEKLLSIVPDSAPLIIQASVLSKDIGFVKVGLPAAIKVDTFDFQKYGLLDGKVTLVAHDSKEDDKLGQIFDVYVRPKSPYMLVEGKTQKLASGMTVVTEVKIGKRRIIEFFIYPMIKYLHEGMGVR